MFLRRFLYISIKQLYVLRNGQLFLNTPHIPQLDDYHQMLCDKPLTIPKCTKALKLLANNKSSDSVGFTTHFYNFWGIDVKEFLFESFKYSLQKQHFM